LLCIPVWSLPNSENHQKDSFDSHLAGQVLSSISVSDSILIQSFAYVNHEYKVD